MSAKCHGDPFNTYGDISLQTTDMNMVVLEEMSLTAAVNQMKAQTGPKLIFPTFCFVLMMKSYQQEA